ncbi:MAG: S-layer homology domain-containing protein [Clostridia bacterium]|nr:S-layer homology domain-containing protein [Clostridia bacterium]
MEKNLPEVNKYTWIFDNKKVLNDFEFNGCIKLLELGSLKIVVSSQDPVVYFEPVSDYTPIDTNKYRYMSIRIKSNSKINYGNVYISTDTHRGYSADSVVGFTLNNDGKWQNIVIDMTENSYWKESNELLNFRIDPIDKDSDIGTEIFIERFGFFMTKEDAEKFGNTESGDNGETHILGNTFMTIIPPGVVSEGFNKKKYSISNDFVPEGVNKNNRPVVFFTDRNNKTSVVPLCYTNPVGWTTYFAREEGEYKVAYNHKTYTDISGHKAEKYIEFVTERELVCGISETEFSPVAPVTYALLFETLGKIQGINTSFAEWAKEIGIYKDGLNLNAPITHEKLGQIISAFAQQSEYYFECSANKKYDFSSVVGRGEFCEIIYRLIKDILYVPNYDFDYSDEHFTRDCIRIGLYGFLLGSYSSEVHEEKMKQAYELGANLIVRAQLTHNTKERDKVFDLAAKYGISALVNYTKNITDAGGGYVVGSTSKDVNPLAFTADYYEHPAFVGHEIADEPGMEHFPGLSDISRAHVAALPGKIPFINLLPFYASPEQLNGGAIGDMTLQNVGSEEIFTRYCDRFCEEFDTDYICVDVYPLNWDSSVEPKVKETYRDYVESLNLVAKSARKHNKEFWCYIQSFSFAPSKRAPTEMEFRWQCYTLLSFGCKTLIHYLYDGWHGMITEYQYPNENYYAAQPVMWELRRLSDTYVQYENLGAFTVNCTDDVPYLKMSGEYKDFEIITGIESENPLLVGCFRKKSGEGYAFTVVNMVDFAADKRDASFTFRLSDLSRTVTIYDKAEKPHVLTSSNGNYTVDLEEGQGVFITVE